MLHGFRNLIRVDAGPQGTHRLHIGWAAALLPVHAHLIKFLGRLQDSIHTLKTRYSPLSAARCYAAQYTSEFQDALSFISPRLEQAASM